MITRRQVAAAILFLLTVSPASRVFPQDYLNETDTQHDARMQWWREARFGLFIHWGLYAIPAGEWKGKTEYGEWIRHSAEIPLAQYDKFVDQFNPTKFDAMRWVRLAKNTGMKYIVITSKHHDGFCLFDSKETDFDVMSTPFKRDILKELSEACRKEGITLCFYHSIMDWHHPDYLPRRPWEEGTRSSDGADFDRYVSYMKAELKELITNYGPLGVLWFDGEWESTWNETRGTDLYKYVRNLQPSIIVNNRVGAGRSGMAGMTKEGAFGGDFGTPEQEVPPTGLPGVDWESCMTMNDNWGYNKNDKHWKSSKELIQTLVDIASKGGNYLLNVGPTAEGKFPSTSINRLEDIGAWMKVNGESIYGTNASPFISLPWGRATRKESPTGTILYFHVCDWPRDGELVIPGLMSTPKKAFFMVDTFRKPLTFQRREDAIVIPVGRNARDQYATVLALEFAGPVEVANPPTIASDHTIFIDQLDVGISSEVSGAEIRFTTDGTVPTAAAQKTEGRVRISQECLVSARLFLNGKPLSASASASFRKVLPMKAFHPTPKQGLSYAYYEGEWDEVPDFRTLQSAQTGTIAHFDISQRTQDEHFGFTFNGYVRVPLTGIYTFATSSDDGSTLSIDDSLIVDNDGLHSMKEERGFIALEEGFHRIRVVFFEKSGGEGLEVFYSGPGIQRQQIPDAVLFHE